MHSGLLLVMVQDNAALRESRIRAGFTSRKFGALDLSRFIQQPAKAATADALMLTAALV